MANLKYNTMERFPNILHKQGMNKLAWWLDYNALPKLNGELVNSIEIVDGKYNIHFYFRNGNSIFGIDKKNVCPSLRAIMDKIGVTYITFCNQAHNYGCLMYYKGDWMNYSKSLDPKDVDQDPIAQYICETLINGTILIKNK